MRYLAARNPRNSVKIIFVPMREKYDCLTCVIAMLLGITYEEVLAAFGGNIDPSKDRSNECDRVYAAFHRLIQQHHRGILELESVPSLEEGRRYWLGIRIDDPRNPLSQTMTHSIVIDEVGRVLDPNPEYGQFKSLQEWDSAMTLPHIIEFATEIFEYSL